MCVAYEVDGVRVEELPASQTDFHHAKPIYEYLPGWKENISKAKSVEDLPNNAREYVKFLEKVSGAPIRLLPPLIQLLGGPLLALELAQPRLPA